MKKWMMAGLLVLALSVNAYAHCGKCGVGDDHAASAHEVHAGAQCPMHGDKNKVLTDAAMALESSNPELAGKLKDLAAKCCS